MLFCSITPEYSHIWKDATISIYFFDSDITKTVYFRYTGFLWVVVNPEIDLTPEVIIAVDKKLSEVNKEVFKIRFKKLKSMGSVSLI